MCNGVDPLLKSDDRISKVSRRSWRFFATLHTLTVRSSKILIAYKVLKNYQPVHVQHSTATTHACADANRIDNAKKETC